MEIILFSFLTAIGKLVVLWKVLGPGRLVRLEKWIDVFFAVLLPILFLGTFSGALLAVMSGLWLSLFLRVLAFFVAPQPLITPKNNQRLHRHAKR